MLMQDANVLHSMAKHSHAMAKTAEGGGDPVDYLKATHKSLTAELSAVELLLSLERQRYQLEAMLKASGKREKVTG